MANFDKAYELTSGNEGYYVSQEYWRKHGNTKSGETYMGVDRKHNPNWEGWAIIDKYKDANGIPKWNFRFPQELGLEPMVKKVSKRNYWDAIKGDDIKSQEIAQMVFEQKWGGYGGIKGIQNAINSISPQKIAVDGGVGNDTLSLLNSLPQDKLMQVLYEERKNWINTTGAKIEPKAVGNWLARLEKFKSNIAEKIESAEEEISTTTRTGIETIKKNPLILAAGVTLISISLFMSYKYFNTQQLKNK